MQENVFETVARAYQLRNVSNRRAQQVEDVEASRSEWDGSDRAGTENLSAVGRGRQEASKREDLFNETKRTHSWKWGRRRQVIGWDHT